MGLGMCFGLSFITSIVYLLFPGGLQELSVFEAAEIR